MRILLDECLPRQLRNELSRQHVVKTVPELAWSGFSDGMILKKVAHKFDVLLTIDQNLIFQQNLDQIPFGIIILSAKQNTFMTLKKYLPEINKTLNQIQLGSVFVIHNPIPYE